MKRALLAALMMTMAHSTVAAAESDSESPVVTDAPEDQPVVEDQRVADEGWPISGAMGQRIYCVEAIESRHGAAMYNPQPVWNGEHAQGWLGFLPSTARRWDVVIGDRSSEWAGAAAMIRAGAGAQFVGIAWGWC